MNADSCKQFIHKFFGPVEVDMENVALNTKWYWIIVEIRNSYLNKCQKGLITR